MLGENGAAKEEDLAFALMRFIPAGIGTVLAVSTYFYCWDVLQVASGHVNIEICCVHPPRAKERKGWRISSKKTAQEYWHGIWYAAQ